MLRQLLGCSIFLVATAMGMSDSCWSQCPDLGYPELNVCGTDLKSHSLPYNFWNCMIFCESEDMLSLLLVYQYLEGLLRIIRAVVNARMIVVLMVSATESNVYAMSVEGCFSSSCPWLLSMPFRSGSNLFFLSYYCPFPRAQAGWKGADCSVVSCPDNACSGHGHCKKKSGCQCTPGFTGQDCSIPVTPLEPLPMVCLPWTCCGVMGVCYVTAPGAIQWTCPIQKPGSPNECSLVPGG